jgi:Tfp pilus assembly protein PilF
MMNDKCIMRTKNVALIRLCFALVIGGIIFFFLQSCATLQQTSSEPTTAEQYIDRGLKYARVEQYDKAIQDFSKAIEINPSYGKAYHNRAVAFTKIGDSEEAAADFAMCFNINYGPGQNASMKWMMGQTVSFDNK